jgi:hypothetical protein
MHNCISPRQSLYANCTAATALVRVTAEDDLANPIISMDCFIFL